MEWQHYFGNIRDFNCILTKNNSDGSHLTIKDINADSANNNCDS